MKPVSRQTSTSKLDSLPTRAYAKLAGVRPDASVFFRLTHAQKALLASLAYSSMSISMVLANKLILSTYKFDFPNVLLLLQCITSLSCVYMAKRLGLVEMDRVQTEKVIQWFPVNIFFLAMLLSGFYSLKLLSVPMLLVFKNSNNVLVTCGDWLFFSQPVSGLIVISLMMLIVATLLSAKEDLEFSFQGYAWTIFNMLASTGYVLYLRHAMKRTKLSQIGMVVHNNFLSVPLVIIADLLTKDDIRRCLYSTEIYRFLQDPWFIALFFFNGVVGSLLNVASFLCVQATSPTTFSMVGALNKVPLALIGVHLFGAKMTFMGAMYVTLSICSGGLYGLAKIQQQQQAEKEKEVASQYQPIEPFEDDAEIGRDREVKIPREPELLPSEGKMAG